MPIVYKEVKLELGYRNDLLVVNKVVIEIKAVEELNDEHTAQVMVFFLFKTVALATPSNF